MTNEIRLERFLESDCDPLIDSVPDARFLLQWAGPNYLYPLDAAQLKRTLAKATGDQPSVKVFKAVLWRTSETVGHIQLMNIDYSRACCRIGRVMIFPGHQGAGLGKEMVRLAVREAFDNLDLVEITLGVFDFNKAAIATYQRLGFKVNGLKTGVVSFRDEAWNLMEMKLINA
ncbi:MAG: GNAT family N-acetyltransferase [Desulfobacteraceae bacterium]|nr:GNAT family N-acetyltransferase [Desulfobacteraceae bacterium]